MRYLDLCVSSLSLGAVLAACAVGATADTSGAAGGAPPDSTSVATEPTPSAPAPADSAAPPVSDAGVEDASTPEASAMDASPPSTNGCAGYAAPAEVAPCKCAAGKTCKANNCYNGYYCELGTTPPKCVPKPASCP